MYNYSKTNGRAIPITKSCQCGYQGWTNYETSTMHSWLMLEPVTQEQLDTKYPDWLYQLANSDILPNAQVANIREKFTVPVAHGPNFMGLYRDFVLTCLERINWAEILKAVKDDKR